MIIIMILLLDYKKSEQPDGMPGGSFHTPRQFFISVNSVHFGSTVFDKILQKFKNRMLAFYPSVIKFYPTGVHFWTTRFLVLLKNFLDFLLLCFLGVALLKIVYKKSRATHCNCYGVYFLPFPFSRMIRSCKSRATEQSNALNPYIYLNDIV